MAPGNRGSRADTPEHRRHRLLVAPAVFTVDQAGPDIQRRFLARQRLLFTLLIGAGLGCMLLATLVLERPAPDLLWPLGGGAVFLLLASAFSRLRFRRLQAVFFGLGLLAAGLVVGWTLPVVRDRTALLLNPTIVVGLGLLGCWLNALLWKKPRSAWVEYLLTGPWLAAGLAVVWFLPAGEWALAGSGLLAVVLVYCLQRAGREAQPLYRPTEVVAAAADVLPLACIAAFGWLWGRD